MGSHLRVLNGFPLKAPIKTIENKHTMNGLCPSKGPISKIGSVCFFHVSILLESARFDSFGVCGAIGP